MERKFTEQEQIRRNKIASLKEKNLLEFASTIKPNFTSQELIDQYDKLSL